MKYLTDLIAQLKKAKEGIEKNPAKWADHEITPAVIQTHITETETKDKEVEDTKLLLAQKQVEARNLQQKKEDFLNEFENFAIAYHSKEPEKLIEYGIEPKKERRKRQAPTVKLTVAIADDTDGEGFILTTQADPDAEMYEWYKGIAADASKTDVIPQMTLFKTTRKLSFVDDDVQKGVRVFYKVRPVNSKGVGPWSEAVSRVQ